MKVNHSFDISASALTAQRLRMDVISSNIANADTTRGKFVDGKWEPYQRKLVVMEPKQASFSQILNSKIQDAEQGGVKVTQIVGDRSAYKPVFDPTHPDADEQGFVLMPNVDIMKEMVDLIAASRSYEANVTALNATKAMMMKALEIGR